ncbi:MAG: hypothetical protein HRU23_17345 [Gammaproteobacteria bacterium]|nr:hypothetical protein [Gammaproteobacteria bacterium]
MKFNHKVLMLAAAVSLSFQASANYNHQGRTYQVTVTNITKGINFTPLLAASHLKSFSLFSVGSAASQNIINIAEGGDISGLNQELANVDEVYNTAATAGLLMPGMSVELEVTASGRYRQLSLVAMALPTNDTLVAMLGMTLPKKRNMPVTYYMKAYDGGSETNDELCANIPGPHCAGVPFSPEDEGEGYIYPSPGIHGEADLSRATYNWHGPVAMVTIVRK